MLIELVAQMTGKVPVGSLAKYVVATVNFSNVVWLKKLLKGMEEITEPMIIY